MRLTLLLISTTITFGCFSQLVHQQSKATTITSEKESTNETLTTEQFVQNYGLDYELVDYTFVAGDSILYDMNLQNLYDLRKEAQDTEYIDLQRGVTILVYSRQRGILERQTQTLSNE
jgi:hypothetical protein